MGVCIIISRRSRDVAASDSYRNYRLAKAGVKVQFCVLYLTYFTLQMPRPVSLTLQVRRGI